MNKQLFLITMLLLLSACSTTYNNGVETVHGERNATYETASFDNLSYTFTQNQTTLHYNVTIIAKTGFTSPSAEPQIVNETLILTISDAQTDPRVKEALFRARVTGTVQSERLPTRVEIINEAGPQNNTIYLETPV